MNRYRNETSVLCKSKGWDKAPVSTVWLLFTEEIGELASAIRQRKKLYSKNKYSAPSTDNVKNEMGDVFS